jgi:RNA recognition motif-containing protein
MSNLYQTFFYQNPVTNQPSSSTISAKQICRLLCPVSRPSSTTIATAAATTTTSSSIIHSETLVIEYNQITNQYNTEQGWVPLSSFFLFRCVTSLWYYSEENSNNETSEVKGPITCRELASLYFQDASLIKDDTTRVWSSILVNASKDNADEKNEGEEAKSSWKLLSEVPSLKLAMEAFEDVVNVSFFHDNQQNISQSADSDNKKDKQNQSQITDFQFNEEDMVYDDEGNNSKTKEGNTSNDENNNEKEEHDVLLQEFLSSAAGEDENNDSEEEYESDGGTNYVKVKNQWVDARLAKLHPSKNGKKRPLQSSLSYQHQQQSQTNNDITTQKMKKSKNTKPKFNAKHSKHWIYVTNLPTDTNETEVAAYFSKVGILDIDPDNQKPKIKLYRQKNMNGEMTLKGDASICYAKVESVQLAIQLLDDTIFRTIDPKTNQPLSYEMTKNQNKIVVQQAKFEQKTDGEYMNKNLKKKSVSEKKRQVARIAKLQAITWDEGDYNGRITGGIKGLRIIVLKYVFTLKDIEKAKHEDPEKGEDELLESIESIIRKECEEFGVVEKITIFSKNADGVVIVKFSQPSAANDAINFYNNGSHPHHAMKIEASYWDGVTDFTVRDEIREEEDTKKRLDDFGNWLEEQELPEEFALNVET